MLPLPGRKPARAAPFASTPYAAYLAEQAMDVLLPWRVLATTDARVSIPPGPVRRY